MPLMPGLRASMCEAVAALVKSYGSPRYWKPAITLAMRGGREMKLNLPARCPLRGRTRRDR
jgi:hypothetical protein